MTPTPSRPFPRILVWTRFSPDFPSGSPAILAEILARAPADKIEVVAEYRPRSEFVRDVRLPYRVRRYQGFRLLWPFARGSRLRRWAIYATIPLMVLYGLYRVIRFRPQCIVTIYGYTHWILSSYLLSRLTGIPLVYYVHDPYLERMEQRGWLSRKFADRLESRCLRHATVIVLFETLQRRYSERYGVRSYVIRHPARVSPPKLDEPVSKSTGEFVIGFSGTIYDNNRTLLRDLIRVSGETANCRLKLWTNAPHSTLQWLGLPREHVTVEFEADYDRLLDKLGRCDLLYLPLSFHGGPGLPRGALDCVLPTKATDYLQTRRPILVHCPKDYELSQFFTTRKAAYVINDDSPTALADWLRRRRSGWLTELNRQDVEAALSEFEADEKAEAFFDVLRKITGVSSQTSKPSDVTCAPA